jgi:hypothetical protein
MSTFNTVLNLDYEVGPGWFLISDQNSTYFGDRSELVTGGQLALFFDPTSNVNVPPIIFDFYMEPEGDIEILTSVLFHCSGYDPNRVFVESNLTFVYDFGDGHSLESLSGEAIHVYHEVGTYEVTVTLIDEEEFHESRSLYVNVIGPSPSPSPVPTPTLGPTHVPNPTPTPTPRISRPTPTPKSTASPIPAPEDPDPDGNGFVTAGMVFIIFAIVGISIVAVVFFCFAPREQ